MNEQLAIFLASMFVGGVCWLDGYFAGKKRAAQECLDSWHKYLEERE